MSPAHLSRCYLEGGFRQRHSRKFNDMELYVSYWMK